MKKRIFIIAGEASGDALGARLIKAMKEQSAEPLEITGIGGPLMKAEGLDSLLPMGELCVMGLWEVVGHLPRLLRLINGVVEEIEKRQPDIVITIDLPDFNFRVAQRLKKRRRSRAKIVHYVAPSVWAWRPGRAKKIAKFLDGLICLFPFEPAYFAPLGLKAVYTGHPVVESSAIQGDGVQFRKEHGIPPQAPVLGLFFGSRPAEFKMMGPVLKETALIFEEQFPDLHLVVPTLPHLEYDVLDMIKDLKPPSYVVTRQDKKWDAFKACDVALAVSGTVGLELAYTGVPHVIGYKIHPLSWMLVKALLKTKYVHLANILLGQEAIPEFLQDRCKSLLISRALLKLYKMDELRAQQQTVFQKLRDNLQADKTKTPSQKAAAFVLQMLG